jgi:hypothetical protein
MKIIVEIEISDEYKYNLEADKKDKINVFNRNFVMPLDDALNEKILDNSTYIAQYKDKRYIDLIENIKTIDVID